MMIKSAFRGRKFFRFKNTSVLTNFPEKIFQSHFFVDVDAAKISFWLLFLFLQRLFVDLRVSFTISSLISSPHSKKARSFCNYCKLVTITVITNSHLWKFWSQITVYYMKVTVITNHGYIKFCWSPGVCCNLVWLYSENRLMWSVLICRLFWLDFKGPIFKGPLYEIK